MKTQLLLIIFTLSTTSLLSMQPPVQDLQQNIAAARLHNRMHCPLAKLPREIQDHISECLEFNDRETDEEFIKNTKDCKSVKIYDPVHSPLQKIPQMFNFIDEKLKRQKLLDFRDRGYRSTGLQYVYCRDKSKIIMSQATDRYSDDYITYFLIYDLRSNAELYFIEQSEGDDSCDSPVAVSNDGTYFFRKRSRPPYEPFLIDATTGHRIYDYSDDLIGKNFNKQSTKAISEDNVITLLCPEQEHKERSKKTLALYLHQKGICKPFDYTGATQ